MKSGFIISFVILFFLSSGISAQENKADTTASGAPFIKLPPLKNQLLIPDTVGLIKLPDGFDISVPKELEIPDSVILERRWEHLGYTRRPSNKKPILPFELIPDLNFNIGTSHWALPVLGLTTTFSPTLTYSPFERLFLYGGVNFTQFHNMAYIQNIIAPDWKVRSNIISQGFLGTAFVLNDRITLRGTYQRSLYNQMPGNLIFFAPSFQMATFGADIDVWNGLGVSVERVWEFDRNGRVKSDMRYSPYINMNKFMKFLRGY
ncbi:MAG: hypothetical protein LBJ72_01530 [Dysgonamonadaceae bacterium]|nr:hypothetical protein [Dysgonamonadaceae bacterium]